mmetsp:Transcript_30393/g.100646  ORF Transcript_30393/g.100646 Transcript_30393/m.100646 type:complete len:266 (+) Transcript_30393:151-948(+)
MFKKFERRRRPFFVSSWPLPSASKTLSSNRRAAPSDHALSRLTMSSSSSMASACSPDTSRRCASSYRAAWSSRSASSARRSSLTGRPPSGASTARATAAIAFLTGGASRSAAWFLVRSATRSCAAESWSSCSAHSASPALAAAASSGSAQISAYFAAAAGMSPPSSKAAASSSAFGPDASGPPASATALSTNSLTLSSGRTPLNESTIFPPCRSITVGSDATCSACAISGRLSTFTFASRTVPPAAVTSASSFGVSCLQGPHQSA